mmetsp:Transcript_38446/g.115255  ORF Transcript_38446/g.115255 Transcript_38446/m.115255 type:complete len:313 (-) Transcript_38446:462-1400(-)
MEGRPSPLIGRDDGTYSIIVGQYREGLLGCAVRARVMKGEHAVLVGGSSGAVRATEESYGVGSRRTTDRVSQRKVKGSPSSTIDGCSTLGIRFGEETEDVVGCAVRARVMQREPSERIDPPYGVGCSIQQHFQHVDRGTIPAGEVKGCRVEFSELFGGPPLQGVVVVVVGRRRGAGRLEKPRSDVLPRLRIWIGRRMRTAAGLLAEESKGCCGDVDVDVGVDGAEVVLFLLRVNGRASAATATGRRRGRGRRRSADSGDESGGRRRRRGVTRRIGRILRSECELISVRVRYFHLSTSNAHFDDDAPLRKYSY